MPGPPPPSAWSTPQSAPLLCLLTTACHTPHPVGCDAHAAPADAQGGAENVLILLLDDVGVDKVGAYGLHPDAPATPRLDALAAQGVRFDRAYAAPTCSPTRAALLTGRHPSRTGLGMWIDPRPQIWSLQPSEITIPEALQQAAPNAWSTAAVGKWHLTTFNVDRPELDPNRQGFDTFRGILGNPTMALGWDGSPRGYAHWERVVDGTPSWDDRWITSVQIDDALELATTLPEPWFLYVALSAAHTPWDPPPGLPLTHTGPDRYDQLVTDVDAGIGRLLDGMSPDLLQRTTVITLGDNGTPADAIREPWEPHRSKETLFEGGVRVPLIVTGPRVSRPGSTLDALVHVVDLLPTVADIAGIRLDDLRGEDEARLVVDGRSLLPLLDDPQGADRRACVMVEQFDVNGLPASGDPERAVIGPTVKIWRRDQDRVLTVTSDPSTEDDADTAPRREFNELSRALDAYRRELGW